MNSEMSRPRLFLIDGYSNIFRSFYAIRSLTNSAGLPTNATYGFIKTLRKLLKDENPEYIGVAFDLAGPTVRDDTFSEYKANRRPTPDDLKVQIPWVRRVIEAFNIPVVDLEKYEADDVLGTLAAKAEAEGVDVVLVSADKDLMQLVGPHVSLLHTGRDKLYRPELVEQDFGVPPEQVVDVLALQGDAVDNVPGVKGIGAKGAVSLIREFGSLESLLDRAAEVPRKAYREGLEQHRDDAEMSKELVTIHRDLPIEFNLRNYTVDPPDPEALGEVLRELEFFSLLEEIRNEGVTIGSGVSIDPSVEVTELDELKARLSSLGESCVLNSWEQDGVEGVVFVPEGAGSADDAGESFFVDLRNSELGDMITDGLSEWVADSAHVLAGHDLKSDLARLGLPSPACRLVDTMILSQLIPPGNRGLALAETVFERFQHPMLTATEVGWEKGQVPMLGATELAMWAGERASLVSRLAELLKPEQDPEIAKIYREIEEPLIPVLLAMEQTGIELDSDFLAELSVGVTAELEQLQSKIFDLAGEEFNLQSPKQMGVILFEKLGYPVLKKTKKTKSYSTSAATLQALADQGLPLPTLILEHRELSKLLSTYIDALPLIVGDDGRLHTRYNQVGAATGRLSSSNPNLQNIPIRTKRGQEIRKAFLARDGYQLVVADYSQIELRLLAHIAEEEEMLAAFAAGEDIHLSTASKVLGLAREFITAEQRRAAKVINFGILYGMSAWGLAQNLKIPPKDAQSFIDTYLARYPKVQVYIDSTIADAEAEGKVETLHGRPRWLPELNNRNRAVRENARRMAINARIQGTAADILKLAMIAVDHKLRDQFPDASLLLTVHDELVVECPEGQVEEVSQLVVEEMSGVEELKVPLVVDLGSGKTWYDAKG